MKNILPNLAKENLYERKGNVTYYSFKMLPFFTKVDTLKSNLNSHNAN